MSFHRRERRFAEAAARECLTKDSYGFDEVAVVVRLLYVFIEMKISQQGHIDDRW